MSRVSPAVRLGCISLAIGLALLVGGCAATGPGATTPLAATSPTQAVIAPQPAPGATSTPDPSSWDAVVAPAGFTAAVVTIAEAGVDPEVDAAVGVVTARAGAGAQVSRVTLATTATTATAASASGDPFAGILADAPDLVIVLGPELLDATDRSSASNLGQQFLVIGAQLPEPTANVTAVVWAGADARRIDEPRSVPNGMSDLAARADDAFRAGLSALLTDTTGGVLVLP